MMTRRWLTTLVTLGCALLVAACGGGSGRGGTDIAVTGAGPSETVLSGDTAVFVMTVANVGDNDASDITVVDLVGDQLTLTEIVCTAEGGAVCPDPDVSMVVSSLPQGSSLTFTVSARVANGASGSFVNTMSATYGDDVDRANNSVTVDGTAYSPNGDIVVGGTGPTGSVAAGGSAEFVMTVRNQGPDEATGVHIVNTVGGNLTLTNVECSATGGAVCPSTLGIVMDVERLPVGGALEFSITTSIAVGTSGTIANTLNVTVDNDATRTDNSFVATGTAAAYNLNVTGTAPTGPIQGGSLAIFTAIVANSGPSSAQDVVITDTTGPNLTLQKVTCTATGEAICPTTLGATMVAPSIPSGDSLSFSVQARVTAGANGTLSNTLNATALGEARPADNTDTASVAAVSADLGVSQTAAATVGAGGSAVFTAVVANPGPGAAANITVMETLTAGYSASIACTASSGATCPTALGTAMTVPNLPVGRSLTFTYTVPVSAAARGNIVNTVQVAASADADTGNNSASATTTAIDARNGSYKAYAADGRPYELTVDFDARTYTMAGNAQTVVKSFTTGTNGDFTVSGNARFRVATDLLVGGHDFGAGVVPFVAARSFATGLSELAGSYNLATRNLLGLAPVTHAGTARISGNVLQVCQSNTSLKTPQNCDAGALKSYVLSISGNVVTGIESVTGEIHSFRLARTGALKVLLSAETALDGSQQLRIGLPDTAALSGGSLRGSSSTGDWGVMSLSTSNYAFAGSIASDSASLTRISAGPSGMLSGRRSSDSEQIYVMQASPIAIVVGDFGGLASGLLQIAAP
jgi:uncharacterized repeat protein (TIGR01451 family)